MKKQTQKSHSNSAFSSRVFLKSVKDSSGQRTQFPDLLHTQKFWFDKFENYYLNKLFEDVSPIEDIAWEKLVLSISDLKITRNFSDNTDELTEAELDRYIENCKRKELTFWWVMNCAIELKDRTTSEIVYKWRANIGTMPLMTKAGTYIISWVENVIINQIIRSYGIFYELRDYEHSFKILPQNGSWFTVVVEKKWEITMRVNKSRKFPITALFRVFWYETDEDIKQLFTDIFDEEDFDFIEYTLKKDPTSDKQDAAMFIYNKLRPGEIVDEQSAIAHIIDIFWSDRVDLWSIARRKINTKLSLSNKKNINYIDLEDIVESIKYLCHFANDKKWYFPDDPDHLSNKRVKTMWELLYWYLSPVMRKFQKSTRGKLSILPLEQKIVLIEDKQEKKSDEESTVSIAEDDEEDDENNDMEITADNVDIITNVEDRYEKILWSIVMEDVLDPNRDYIFTESFKIKNKIYKGWSKISLIDLNGLINKNKLERYDLPIQEDTSIKNTILIKKGTRLTNSYVNLLKKNNIEYVVVRPQLKLVDIVNFKIIDTAIKSFFATSELSQYAHNMNPISEVEHKRRLTAWWPWWLRKQTAKFEVRDVHLSHYGRICPIQTPEWQPIWLVIHQALYSKINDDWFIETPAVRVSRECKLEKKFLINKILEEDDIVGSNWKLILKEWEYITEENVDAILKYAKDNKLDNLKLRSYIIQWSDGIERISPEYDHECTIWDNTTQVDEYGNILQKRLPARWFDQYGPKVDYYHVNEITHVDLTPSQLLSADGATLPFVDHDDADRALMAAAQQKQAVSLIKPQAPIVATGIEWEVVKNTTSLIVAEWDGEVIYVWWKKNEHNQIYNNMDYIIKVRYNNYGSKKNYIKEYNLTKFSMSNQKSLVHLRPRVDLWQTISIWDILAEWQSVVNWELSLGTNLKVAFMPWGGYNFEDAMIISDRLIKDDRLTSVFIEKFEIEVSDTKLGPEQTTSDIPGVSMSKLKNLDENGIIRIWSIVKWNDILVGKISPKNEWELSAEEKLIQAVFGEKSKNVKDSSLYLPSGVEGKVLDVVVLDSKRWDNLMAWVKNKIIVFVATSRKIEVWDKLAWRHGNKWIISVILSEEDMPYTADGDPIDIILNPIGVVSRMNIWQIYENHLWLIWRITWHNFAVPLFSDFNADDLSRYFGWELNQDDIINLTNSGLSKEQISLFSNQLQSANLPSNGKFDVYDGRTWEKYDNPVAIWYMYLLKLEHMVEDKIHARSIWPYSLITQQPLSGKARDWWQRFGEMEVRALEAHGAVNILQEMLTIKSDDINGRNKTYDAIIRWKKIQNFWTPESYYYLSNIFKWLCQSITALTKDEIENIHQERRELLNKINLKWLEWVEDAVAEEINEWKWGASLLKKWTDDTDDVLNDISDDFDE